MNIKIVWIRGTHTFTSLIVRFLNRFSLFQGMCNPSIVLCIPKKMHSLWIFLEVVAIIPLVISRFIISCIFNDFVIAECSLADFVTWSMMTLKRIDVVKNFSLRSMLALSKAPCLNIYIRADLENEYLDKSG